MKRWIIRLGAIGVLSAFVLVLACGKKEATGTAIDASLAVTKIADILSGPETFVGKQVVVSGKITMECGSGCWFYVDDGAQIYVDLSPANLAIPQWVGKTVKVMGKVAKDEDRIIINASGVEM